MESQKIEILLNRYWEGQATPEEEAEIREMYREGRVTGKNLIYEPVFAYPDAVRTAQEPEEFDLSFLDEAPAGRDNTVSISARKYRMRWAAGVAAAILIAIGSVTYQWPHTQTLDAKAEEMERAYRETLYALNEIANKLNEGRSSIYEIGAFDETKNQIIDEK